MSVPFARELHSMRQTQLPPLSHLSRAFPGATELLERRITISLQTPHLSGIFFQSSDDLQKPYMTDSQLPRPIPRRRSSFITASEPPQHESPNHEAFFCTAPRPRRMPTFTRPRRGMPVFLVTVREGKDKPYSVKERGFYIRIGATNRIATKYEVDEMYSAKQNPFGQ
jgi:hypothetical protein